MKKKVVIPIVIIIILLALTIIGTYFILNKKTIITLDINPSIKLEVNKKNRVTKLIALNEDAKPIIDGVDYESLEKVINRISTKVIENDYTNENGVVILLHIDGNIKEKDVETELKHAFVENNVSPKIITIKKITKEDKKLAKKYNITPAKAAYLKTVKNVSLKNLVNKSIEEIKNTKENGLYCDEDYFLEGDSCYKEIRREETTIGEICPAGSNDYDGTCYEETKGTITDKDVCDDEWVLENKKCKRTDIYPAEGICENGDYEPVEKNCIVREYIGDASEYCRDPGRTLYDHKCLATKPTINGGCLGSDHLLDGKCVNMIDDYYASDWICPNGQTNSRPDGSLINEDNKCYKEKRNNNVTFKCNKGDTLDGTNCIHIEYQKPHKEKQCPSGYTLTNRNQCLNFSNKANKISGNVCDMENSKQRGNECIIYERKEAKQVK